ncbi:MAG: hypothetical protein R2710_16895 [Acidimicrobiales bacterium]
MATGLWLWFRGRRFGKVVAEPQLVEIPASLLVRSSAELQRRAKGDEWAAAALRSDFSARLRTEHRLGPDTPPDLVATVVAQRTGYPADALMAIMVDRSGGEPDLAELVTRIDHATPNVSRKRPSRRAVRPRCPPGVTHHDRSATVRPDAVHSAGRHPSLSQQPSAAPPPQHQAPQNQAPPPQAQAAAAAGVSAGAGPSPVPRDP